ncbi:MAG: hypothetical protein ACRDGA_03035 [Bacteroidota bacterium]
MERSSKKAPPPQCSTGTTDVFESYIDEEMEKIGGKSTALSGLLARLERLEAQIAVSEKALAGLNEDRRTLTEASIPDELMAMGNLTKIKTDEVEVEVRPFYSAKILDFGAVEAYLTEHGFGGIIKAVCEVPLGRLSDESSATRKEFYAVLDKLGIPYEDKKSIHSQTLAAFVKEQTVKDGGLHFPPEMFSVYIGRVAKVKKLK